MAAPYNFRTSLNGFNREDVVHYIEFINTKHATQINQLRADLADAQQENAALRAHPPQDPQILEKLQVLNDESAQQELRIEELSRTVEEVTAQRDAARQELTVVKAQRDLEKTQIHRRNDDELEAYRRAERMERQAKERADMLYQRANAVLADATAKVDDVADQISGIADQVSAQLQVLQAAVADSKVTLKDAATTLYSIRPGE